EAIHAQVDRAFDLHSGQLLRASLVHLAHDCHVLVVVVHHIAWDGWSRAIVLRDLEAAYARAVRGDTRQPGELEVRYRDFAVWHRGRIDGPDLESDRQYWRDALQNAPHVVELPADYPRAARPSFAGATHRFVLPQPLVERLRALGRAHGATLFM